MSVQEQIEKILDEIVNPSTGGGLIASNNIKGMHVDDAGNVKFIMEFPSTQVELGMKLREEAIQKVNLLQGVADVHVVLTADKKPRPKGKKREQISLPGVKNIVLVGSGKGGVGKSTTSVNLASALSQKGLTVGIVDADVYGPSLPRMLGVNRRPYSEDGKMMEPIEHLGLQCMSIGFMMAESLPTIWRGPMVQSAIMQMLRQTLWKDVDVLVIDLPPGTGDIPITLAQSFVVSGAVIVSTPQDISLIDARKAVNMLSRMEIPIMGIIENMSYFACPHCGEKTDIFHHGGARHEAGNIEVPFLGEIPLDPAVRETSDEGKPIVLDQPESSVAKAYLEMAGRIGKVLETKAVKKAS